ncbi:hypothetical protein AFM41_004430 [Escherichia coli]|nr:hypothetical protein [Escherichia coli]
MQEGIAIVKVNNIEVGSMPISQYEEIVKSVKKDWRTHVASVFCYIGFAWRIILKLWHYFVHGFAIFIASIMFYSIYHQAELIHLITFLRNSPSENIAEIIRVITYYCIALTVIAVAISIAAKGIPIFVSATEIAINKKIREVMEVPTEGQVSITFKKDGVYSVR